MRTMALTMVAVVLCVALSAVVAIKLASGRKPAPTFCGRTVTQWVTSSDFQTNRAAVDLAVIALGPGAVPELRRMLHSGTKWERVWFAKAPRWLYQRFPVGRDQFDRKDRAMSALMTLGPVGRPATPDLLEIAQDTTENCYQRMRATTVLCDIRADPAVVVPVMESLKYDPAIAKFAVGCARYLKEVAALEESARLEGLLAASDSAKQKATKPEFEPSSSFLDKSPLWGPGKSKPPTLTLGGDGGSTGSSRPPAPTSEDHSFTTNGSPR